MNLFSTATSESPLDRIRFSPQTQIITSLPDEVVDENAFDVVSVKNENLQSSIEYVICVCLFACLLHGV